ncbi:hypothetical protein [uncultured Tateyamaria sp.]|uniref:hypothetical protein n=1 Tax=uncultured Tateyamaria sp. TaxID=455651 RepID=UPI002608DFF3|nr:hypothetical protein [uncultured Tateyamaria sp.]
MTRAFLLVLFLCLHPVAAAAEWRIGPGSEIFVGYDSAFGVTAQGGALGVMCLDRQPFLWTQGWAAAVAGAERVEQFAVIVDGVSFVINGTHVPPDGLWYGTPPSGLVEALKSGSQAAIGTQNQPPVSVSLRGSSRALATVLDGCSTVAASPTPAVPGALLDQLITSACGGGYALAQGAEFTGRLDGDDRPDIILNWAGVTCDDRSKGRGAGFCGAAFCTIDLVFTQTGGRQQILGVNPRLVDRAYGLSALQTTTQGQTCGGPAQVCDVIWTWNGTQMEAQP